MLPWLGFLHYAAFCLSFADGIDGLHGTAAGCPSAIPYRLRRFDPPGTLGGSLAFTSGSQQMGSVSTASGGYAAIWSGLSHSVVNLNPFGASWSFVSSSADGQQAGAAWFVSNYHAGIWTGTAASFRDLNPSTASTSVITGTSGSQQVGYAVVSPSGYGHAALWSGAASFVDLNPPEATGSLCYGVANVQQVFLTRFTAGGTPARPTLAAVGARRGRRRPRC